MDENKSEEHVLVASAPPRIIKSMVNFELGPINPRLTCRLCEGYFRDPTTITECLHTFCKSCLYYAFSAGFAKCPTCEIQLGTDPYKSTLPDRTLEELVDKVLFPDIKVADDKFEAEFYEKKGIKMKAEYLALIYKKHLRDATPDTTSYIAKEYHHHQETALDDEVDFCMTPCQDTTEHKMPRMQYDLLSTSGRIKILNLKRFLKARLGIDADIEMTCNGQLVGNELSLNFIQRTIWMDDEVPIELEYRYAEDFESPGRN